MSLNIAAWQAHVRELSEKFGDKTPETRLLHLMSEVGELSDELLALQQLSADDTAQTDAIKQRLGMEIYDVIWNAIDLANLLEIDLEAAFEQKIALNKKRWPDE